MYKSCFAVIASFYLKSSSLCLRSMYTFAFNCNSLMPLKSYATFCVNLVVNMSAFYTSCVTSHFNRRSSLSSSSNPCLCLMYPPIWVSKIYCILLHWFTSSATMFIIKYYLKNWNAAIILSSEWSHHSQQPRRQTECKWERPQSKLNLMRWPIYQSKNHFCQVANQTFISQGYDKDVKAWNLTAIKR